MQHRVRGFCQQREHELVRQGCDQTARKDDRFAADTVRQGPEEQEAAGAKDQRPGHQDVGRVRIDLDDVLQEEQGIELARVPHDRLPRDQTQKRDECDLGVQPAPDHRNRDKGDADVHGKRPGQRPGKREHQHQDRRDQQDQGIAPRTKSLAQRSLGRRPFFLHLLEGRALVHLQTDVERDQQQEDRSQERDAPAPGVERLHHCGGPVGVHRRHAGRIKDRLVRESGVYIARDRKNDDQRQQQPQRCRGLDKGREVAALVGRGMFCHVNRRTAIFTAKRQTLKHPQDDQNDRCRNTPAVVVGQKADEESRHTHDDDGHQEGVFPSDQVTQRTEDQRAKGAHDEPGGKGQQRKDVPRCFREWREELRPDDGCKRAIQVEVIPFEDRAGRGGEDNFPLLCRHRT